jgi:protein-serine/threonine kinase
MIKKSKLDATELQFHRREIDMLKMCQHPNIINIIDVYESLDYIFIILKYMEGGDLFDFLELTNHYIEEKFALKIFKQVVEGVKYLHDLGIIHRDLKIENIMMSSKREDAVPKIVDFGLSTSLRKDM